MTMKRKIWMLLAAFAAAGVVAPGCSEGGPEPDAGPGAGSGGDGSGSGPLFVAVRTADYESEGGPVAGDRVVLRIAGRAEDDGNPCRLGVGLEDTGHLEAAHLTHHDVEQDQRIALGVHLERLFGAVGDIRLVALDLEVELQDLAERLFVIDDQDFVFCHSSKCLMPHQNYGTFTDVTPSGDDISSKCNICSSALSVCRPHR